MNTNPSRSKFLSTPKSVAIFGVALCLGVAVTTDTVFAFRDNQMEVQDRKVRERGELELDGEGRPNATRVELPLMASRFGAEQSTTTQAPNPGDRVLSDLIFSSQFSPVGPMPTKEVTNLSNTFKLPLSASSAPMSGLEVPAIPRAVLGADAGTPSQFASSQKAGAAAVVTVQCGVASCPQGQVCCNASCGTCAAPGALCSQLICGL